MSPLPCHQRPACTDCSNIRRCLEGFLDLLHCMKTNKVTLHEVASLQAHAIDDGGSPAWDYGQVCSSQRAGNPSPDHALWHLQIKGEDQA